jgi:hypothetical protein
LQYFDEHKESIHRLSPVSGNKDFVLIGDEATDVSTHEQISVCVRFVECTGGKVILCEEFLGSVSASKTIGENLAELYALECTYCAIRIRSLILA